MHFDFNDLILFQPNMSNSVQAQTERFWAAHNIEEDSHEAVALFWLPFVKHILTQPVWGPSSEQSSLLLGLPASVHWLLGRLDASPKAQEALSHHFQVPYDQLLDPVYWLEAHQQQHPGPLWERWDKRLGGGETGVLWDAQPVFGQGKPYHNMALRVHEQHFKRHIATLTRHLSNAPLQSGQADPQAYQEVMTQLHDTLRLFLHPMIKRVLQELRKPSPYEPTDMEALGSWSDMLQHPILETLTWHPEVLAFIARTGDRLDRLSVWGLSLQHYFATKASPVERQRHLKAMPQETQDVLGALQPSDIDEASALFRLYVTHHIAESMKKPDVAALHEAFQKRLTEHSQNLLTASWNTTPQATPSGRRQRF